MRNPLLKLMAAGALLLSAVLGVWCAARPPVPADSAESAAKQEEARRAQEIVDNVQQGHVGNARALADAFYREYPTSPEIPNIERLTGYHPRPYRP